MAQSKKSKKKGGPNPVDPAQPPAGDGPPPGATSDGPRPPGPPGDRLEISGRRPVLRFVLILAGAMLIFNALFNAYVTDSSWFDRYLAVNARLSATILCWFGEQASADQTRVSSPRLPQGMIIKTGCDGVQASAFFVFMLLASPVAVRLVRRLPVIVVGTLALLVLNIVRVISLYFARISHPRLFEVLHEEIWQPVFIVLPLLFWFVWLRRVGRRGA